MLAIKSITGGFMTKLEFADKLETYYKKQTMNKWLFFTFGVVLITFVFMPSIILSIDENMFGFTSTTLAIFGGLLLGKAWDIKRGTEEHELLVNALDLLSDNKDT
tara:strand:- start:1628 stop:1942 length:315 start_codon:yes stop_codon:yes gene_type:complete